jgi:hypothetical protein
MSKKSSIIVVCIFWICPLVVCQQRPEIDQPGTRLRSTKIQQFDVSDGIMRDGISELSLKNVEALHVGFEESIRQRSQDNPSSVSNHFSLHLQNKSIGEILDALCAADPLYTWAEDGHTINIYPRAVATDSSYLLNLRIDRIDLKDVPDPDQALTPLSRLFPKQQVGYFGPGLAGNRYPKPWTIAFQDLTVRQFINRIAEHMASQTSWVWQGGSGERMFTFLRGGFRTTRPGEREPKAK